ncbi:hypothetical protein ILYODFUR_019672, partial [Ilyodon furcidens]
PVVVRPPTWPGNYLDDLPQLSDLPELPGSSNKDIDRTLSSACPPSDKTFWRILLTQHNNLSTSELVALTLPAWTPITHKDCLAETRCLPNPGTKPVYK